jgi:hypothetical protein
MRQHDNEMAGSWTLLDTDDPVDACVKSESVRPSTSNGVWPVDPPWPAVELAQSCTSETLSALMCASRASTSAAQMSEVAVQTLGGQTSVGTTGDASRQTRTMMKTNYVPPPRLRPRFFIAEVVVGLLLLFALGSGIGAGLGAMGALMRTPPEDAPLKDMACAAAPTRPMAPAEGQPSAGWRLVRESLAGSVSAENRTGHHAWHAVVDAAVAQAAEAAKAPPPARCRMQTDGDGGLLRLLVMRARSKARAARQAVHQSDRSDAALREARQAAWRWRLAARRGREATCTICRELATSRSGLSAALRTVVGASMARRLAKAAGFGARGEAHTLCAEVLERTDCAR